MSLWGKRSKARAWRGDHPVDEPWLRHNGPLKRLWLTGHGRGRNAAKIIHLTIECIVRIDEGAPRGTTSKRRCYIVIREIIEKIELIRFSQIDMKTLDRRQLSCAEGPLSTDLSTVTVDNAAAALACCRWRSMRRCAPPSSYLPPAGSRGAEHAPRCAGAGPARSQPSVGVVVSYADASSAPQASAQSVHEVLDSTALLDAG